MSTDPRAPSAGIRPRLAAFAALAAVAFWVVAVLTVATTAEARLERDIARIVYNRNVDLLATWLDEAEDASFQLKQNIDAAEAIASNRGVPSDAPYLVVSLEDRTVALRQGDAVLFEAPIAVGMGAVTLGGKTRRFDTPRGRREVVSKELDPTWVPPDWHYQEIAQKRGLTMVRLQRGQSIPLSSGGSVEVRGSDVVRVGKDGEVSVFKAGDEPIVDGKVVIPPFGTRQRKYKDVLGTRRLNLGDGYAIHGTNRENTIGTASSHGCIRMKNEDIETLFPQVPVHTPVFIY